MTDRDAHDMLRRLVRQEPRDRLAFCIELLAAMGPEEVKDATHSFPEPLASHFVKFQAALAVAAGHAEACHREVCEDRACAVRRRHVYDA